MTPTHPMFGRLPAVLAAAAVATFALFTLFATWPAHADDDGRRVPLLPKYKAECGACHVAYPPGMLPAASWQRLMGRLGTHFGSDASLADADLRELSTWLAAHAATGKRSTATPPPQDRITRSAWFVREHDEVAAATWQRPAIKGAANCAACHTRADEGSFRERDIRIPK